MLNNRNDERVYRTRIDPDCYHFFRNCRSIVKHPDVFDVLLVEAAEAELRECKFCLEKLGRENLS